MKKVLIVYATREGQTEKIAHRISNNLKNYPVEVNIHNAIDPFKQKLSSFDTFVFGGSMHAGGIEKELIQFIKEFEAEITLKKRTFFLVTLSAATEDLHLREKWLTEASDKLNKQLSISFDHVEMIAGALRYSKYPFFLKWVMKRIAKKANGDTDTSKDYEYTDWNQVEEFSKNLLEI